MLVKFGRLGRLGRRHRGRRSSLAGREPGRPVEIRRADARPYAEAKRRRPGVCHRRFQCGCVLRQTCHLRRNIAFLYRPVSQLFLQKTQGWVVVAVTRVTVIPGARLRGQSQKLRSICELVTVKLSFL